MTYTLDDDITIAVKRRPSVSNCNNLLARIVVISSVVLSVFGIILYSYDLYRHGRRKHLIGWFSSAGFVLLTFAISIRLIVLHLTHWYSPSIQKWLVRIIWMVPIYSIESWLALRFRDQALYIETVRESYEAYAIFSFLYYLIALLGEEATLVARLKEKSDERGEHSWPLNWCVKPWGMGADFLHRSKLGVLQYVLLKNLMAVVIFILQILDFYEEGQFRFDRGYLYVCFISNTSQVWALYCLIKFYYVMKEELTPWSPLRKFMCVKTVVFFTWWQSLLVSFVAASMQISGSSGAGGNWSREQIVMGFQDYLICIEMFIASIAFSVSFTYNDFLPKHKDDEEEMEEGRPFLTALLQSSIPDDILGDIRRVAKGQDLFVRSSVRKKDIEAFQDDISEDYCRNSSCNESNVQESRVHSNTSMSVNGSRESSSDEEVETTIVENAIVECLPINECLISPIKVCPSPSPSSIEKVVITKAVHFLDVWRWIGRSS